MRPSFFGMILTLVRSDTKIIISVEYLCTMRTLGVWTRILTNYRSYGQAMAVWTWRNVGVRMEKRRYGMGKGVRMRIACRQRGVDVDRCDFV